MLQGSPIFRQQMNSPSVSLVSPPPASQPICFPYYVPPPPPLPHHSASFCSMRSMMIGMATDGFLRSRSTRICPLSAYSWSTALKCTGPSTPSSMRKEDRSVSGRVWILSCSLRRAWRGIGNYIRSWLDTGDGIMHTNGVTSNQTTFNYTV